MERDNVGSRGLDAQIPRNFSALFVQEARARAQDRRVAIPLCDRIDEPINLAIDFAEPQLKVNSLGIRFGCETFTLFV